MSNSPVIAKIDGVDGVGIATGGSTGQHLYKVSGTNYDTAWQTPVAMPAATVDGATMRYETTGSTWQESTALIIDDTGDVLATGSITAGSANDEVRIGEDGIYFEADKHAITFNDGFGNFNLRVANNGITDENCTEAGYTSHLIFTQSTGLWQFQVSSASLAIDDPSVFRSQLEIDANDVALMYQASQKLVTTSAGVTVTGTLTETSSIRYKENVRPLTGCLTKVTNLSGVIYDKKDGTEINAPGLIAEDVYKVIPELVTFNDDGEIDGLHYTKLSAYLIESVKTLDEKTNKINNLEERIEKLEQLING